MECGYWGEGQANEPAWTVPLRPGGGLAGRGDVKGEVEMCETAEERLLRDKRYRLAIRMQGRPDPGPREGMCEVCGCTQEDPCIDVDGEACGWQDATKTLCTTCRELYSK